MPRINPPNNGAYASFNPGTVTTTSNTNIASVTHTSKTGKVSIVASGVIKTSRYTSGLRVLRDADTLAYSITNLTTPITIMATGFADAPVGEQKTYSLNMFSQDSGTTATYIGYHYLNLLVTDV